MSRARLVRAIVATDNTFERRVVRGAPAWVGRCIHCQTRLVVPEDGEAAPDVTVEHIVPRHHGGTDDPSNLALACARCNAEKGMRHDNKRRDDRRRLEIEEMLLARRRSRWREPTQ
jgi:5-methylcytosine-specific restriction endonuclease McrA